MTCEEVVKSDVVENYLHDRLDDESREAFELHYFDCAACFRLVQTYRELQAELARTRDEAVLSASPRRWIWQWAWLPAAAVLTLAVGLTVWQRPDAEPPETPAVTEPAAPSTPARPPVQAPPPVSLADLARVEPPRYTPGRLRGAGDEATARYQEAMKSYERGDYDAATTGLAAAAVLDPEAPHAVFFLGISHLMTGRSDEAVDALRQHDLSWRLSLSRRGQVLPRQGLPSAEEHRRGARATPAHGADAGCPRGRVTADPESAR